jgi:hypothetical protein
MTPESPPAAPRQARRMPRVPPFYPVPIRARRDGWTIRRQADFLGMLAETGSVMGACEAVGMSRKSAYALRARRGAESFAAAWDAALGAPVRMVTPPALETAAREGAIRLVMFRGRYRAWWRRPDDRALLQLVRRSRHATGQGDTVSPEW